MLLVLGSACGRAVPGPAIDLIEKFPSAIEVRPVSSAADRTLFIELPYQVQAADPNWIAPLRFERRQHIDPRRNPWFEHAQARFFLAWRDGRPVGRISAQIDSLASGGGSAPAQFGMLEAVHGEPEVIGALLGAAEAFARQQGRTRLQGPFSLSINDECGLLIEGFDTPPAMMMGHAPPEYRLGIEALDYAKAKDLVTYEIAYGTRRKSVTHWIPAWMLKRKTD